jgi:serine/threonine-protein kinase RsbW
VLSGSIGELERLVAEVAEFCREHELDDAVEFDLNLVLEELFTNSVRHGGCAAAPDAARIRLRATADGVELLYSDGGRPFDPLNVPAPDLNLPLLEREPGGLGVHLVRQIMQDVRYRRTGDRNELTMVRRMEPK